MKAEESFPIALSFEVATVALLFAAPLGTALAWIQARRRYRLRRAVDAAILLPLVLPPSVVGYLLVLAFGARGVAGRAMARWFGVELMFTPAAAVMASAVVALPILVKTAQPAIEAVPSQLEDVARSMGLSELMVLARVTLPCAARGLAAALVLGFARALGELGATLIFAGNVPGRTNTMPIEILAAYQAGDDHRALLYVGVLTASSLAIVGAAARLAPRARS